MSRIPRQIARLWSLSVCRLCGQQTPVLAKGICDVSSRKILGQIMELGHDIIEEETGVANDDLDKATLKVSDQTEASEEAFEELSDDDGFRSFVRVCVYACVRACVRSLARS